MLNQYHHVSTSSAPYWPSTTKYQPVPPSTDPIPPSTDKHRPVLTQYHHISTSTTLYWPITTKYQPVPPHFDPISPRTNQDCPLLTQYHQVSTSAAFYWPSIIKYHIPISDLLLSTWYEHSCTLVYYSWSCGYFFKVLASDHWRNVVLPFGQHVAIFIAKGGFMFELTSSV